MSHPLDDWFASLLCVGISENDEEQDEEHEEQQLNLFGHLPLVLQPEFHIPGPDSVDEPLKEVFAYTPTSSDLMPQPHGKEIRNWPEDQVRLLRMIYRPSQQEISKFLVDW